MDYDRITSIVARFFTVAAFGFFAVAVIQKIGQWVGFAIPSAYGPRVLLETAAIFQILVVPLLLRQIREALKKTSA